MRVHHEHLPPRQQQAVHAGVDGHVLRGARAAALARADDLVDVLQVVGRGAPGAAQQAVDMALLQQHGADERQPAPHLDLRHLHRNALALGEAVVTHPEVAVALVVLDVDDIVVQALLQAQAELLDAAGDDGRPADERGPRQALVDHHLHGAQHTLLLALGIGHAARARLLGLVVDRLHHRARGVHELAQPLTVGLEIGDRARGHAAGGRRLGHGRRDALHQPVIKGLGNQVLGPEAQRRAGVGRGHNFALLGLRQLGDGVHRSDLHGIVHRRCAAVECAAEDVRETQDVVDLVRVVGPAGRNDGVGSRLLGELGRDLGRGVGQREDQRARCHLRQHLGLEHAGSAQAQEDVGPGQHVGQLAVRGVLRELRLVLVHQLGAALVDDAREIRDPDVRARHAQLHQQAQAGQRGSACAAGDELDLVDLLAHHLERVQHRGAHDDGGAVLVVVEHRDAHALAQPALDVEAVGGLDVLEVDAAKGGLQRGDHVDELVEVLLGDLDVEDVDAGELLEEHRLAFHHRLGGQRADVAQAQHGGAVGDHGHQVAARGVAEHVGGVGDDLLTGCGHAGAVGQREIALVQHLLGGRDGQLAGRRMLVVVERGTAQLRGAFGRAGIVRARHGGGSPG